MKIKSWYLLLLIIPFLIPGTPALAVDCKAIKKSIPAEKDLRKRRALITEAVKKCPEDPLLNYKYGLTLERYRKYDKALSYYQKAALYDPQMGRAHVGMGDIYIFQGQLDKAVESYGIAAELMPDDSRTASKLARLRAKKKALEGGVLTVGEVLAVMDYRGKIATNTSLLLNGPVLQYKIDFVQYTNELTPIGIKQLAGIGQAFQNDALQHVRFEISTHMGLPLSSKVALENSKLRAQMIKDQLVANFGIDPKRIEIIWHGDTMPLESNGLADEQSLNNRVEFKRILEQ
ncbi:MAG: tetratricopeptide repeat protein [Desulfocapsa sp.]|nr:tetratricopeptide repeat protein [Desulfocapsa sp.]